MWMWTPVLKKEVKSLWCLFSFTNILYNFTMNNVLLIFKFPSNLESTPKRRDEEIEPNLMRIQNTHYRSIRNILTAMNIT